MREEGRTLGEMLKPRREKAVPAEHPDLSYIGLEHVEAHTTKLLGSVSAKEMRSTANRFYSGDVLYSRLRPYLNKVWRADRDGLCSSEFIVLPANDIVDANFLRYRLNADDFVSFANSLNAGDRPRVDFDQISSFILPPFSLSVQRRVVAEIEKQFTRLEAGVSALRRVQANLKRYRAAVLKAACEGKLVPTEAELSRRKKGNAKFESGAELLARILDERRKKWNGRGKYKEPSAPDTANLSALPEGWTWASIEQIAEVGTGATPKRESIAYYDGGKIPWITSSALNNTFVDSAHECVTEKALTETNLTLYPPGTLLLAMYGEGKTRGKCAELRINATTNQAIAAIQCTDEIRSFVKLALCRQYEQLRLTASGGVQPNLNLSLVRGIVIPMSPLAEQTRIVAEVERRLSVVEELEALVAVNLQRAARLRQAILQKAFSGELVFEIRDGKPTAQSSDKK